MKYKLLLFIALFLCPQFVEAQVREFSLNAAANSIVRTVDDDLLLIYSEENPSASGIFALYRVGDPTALYFEFVCGFHVKDFQVWEKEGVYVCGVNDIGGGMVAFFKIGGAFYGGTPIYYTVCPSASDDITLKEQTRLDLFRSSDSVCMAMVGSASFFSSFDYTTVTSVYFDGMVWHFDILENKVVDMRFTDIVCLDTLVVASGTMPNGRDCCFKTFRLSSQFPSHPLPSNSYYKVDYQRPVGDVLAAKVDFRTVALVHFDSGDHRASTVLHNVGLHGNTGIPHPWVDTWQTTLPSNYDYDTSWKMRELACFEDTAVILQKADYPSFSSAAPIDWLLKIKMVSTTTSFDAWHPTYIQQKSMDLDKTTSQPWLSDRRNTYHISGPSWLRQDGHCYTYKDFGLKYNLPPCTSRPFAEGSVNRTESTSTLSPFIQTATVGVVCDD